MKRNLFMALLVFLTALALSAATGFRLRGQQWNFGQEISSQFQPIQDLWPDNILPAQQASHREFISPDGKLKIGYPDDWLAAEEKEVLAGLTPELWSKKYDLEALFFAAKIQEKEPPQIVIYRGNLNLTASEITEEIKRDDQKNGWEATLLSSDFSGKEGIFEVEYKTPEGKNYRSKEKILNDGDGQTYLIMALAAKESWLGIKNEIDKIIDSAIIVN